MDKSKPDIFFNDSFLNGYLKKMITPFHIRPSSLVWFLDMFVSDEMKFKWDFKNSKEPCLEMGI